MNKMKQGIFDIDRGTPIVVAYGLPKPDPTMQGSWDRTNHKVLEEMIKHYKKRYQKYESSRQEWEVENIKKAIFANYTEYYYICDCSAINRVYIKDKIQFTEIQAPKDGKRGKCKIVKII